MVKKNKEDHVFVADEAGKTHNSLDQGKKGGGKSRKRRKAEEEDGNEKPEEVVTVLGF